MFPRWYNPVVIAYKFFEAAGGSGNRAPIIFMHGLMERKETWEDLAKRMAEETRRDVYTYDARNHGQSEHTMDSGFKNNVFDLFHFMEQKKISRSVLVGDNMGGLTAISAALLLPSVVEAIYVEDMHVKKIHDNQIHLYLMLMKSYAEDFNFSPDGVSRPNLALVRVPPPMDRIEDAKLLKSVHLFRALALMDALRKYDENPIMPVSGEFHGPAYFIYGERSPNFFLRDHRLDIGRFFPAALFVKFLNVSSDVHEAEPYHFGNVLSDRIRGGSFNFS